MVWPPSFHQRLKHAVLDNYQGPHIFRDPANDLGSSRITQLPIKDDKEGGAPSFGTCMLPMTVSDFSLAVPLKCSSNQTGMQGSLHCDLTDFICTLSLIRCFNYINAPTSLGVLLHIACGFGILLVKEPPNISSSILADLHATSECVATAVVDILDLRQRLEKCIDRSVPVLAEALCCADQCLII